MSAERSNEGGFAGARCVVTGGLGFIGSDLVHRLVTEGAGTGGIVRCVPWPEHLERIDIGNRS